VLAAGLSCNNVAAAYTAKVGRTMLSNSGLGFSRKLYGSDDVRLEKSFHNKFIIGEGDYDLTNEMENNSSFAPIGHYVLNIKAILVSIVTPWLLFTAMLYLMISKFHYQHPKLTWLLILLGCGFPLVAGILARFEEKRRFPEPRPVWYKYHFLAYLVAAVSAVALGDYLFWRYAERYYDFMTLNVYNNINPAKEKGQMLMDAGRVYWTQGSHVAAHLSMGFKNKDIYCVAPIAKGDEQQPNYDFWAVGINCCNNPPNNFACGEANNPDARSAIRQMTREDRQFYRLAVQQAEAAYGLKALHPVFFHWVTDPVQEVNNYMIDAIRKFVWSSISFFCINFFFVIVATIAFSKIGRHG
jgi:hypothetical protein